MHTVKARRITRQYPGDSKATTLTVWDVHNPAGTVVDSYNHKRDATKAARHWDDMTNLYVRAGLLAAS